MHRTEDMNLLRKSYNTGVIYVNKGPRAAEKEFNLVKIQIHFMHILVAYLTWKFIIHDNRQSEPTF
jgi:hypothetical protein